jgi:formylglycine-generating enzyme required for sulfatase activity
MSVMLCVTAALVSVSADDAPPKKFAPKIAVTKDDHAETVDPQLTAPPPSLPKEIVSKSTGMKLVLIPSGAFLMGSSAADLRATVQADSTFKEEEGKHEQPQHRVRIARPFYMGVYEVTQEEYEMVTGTNPSWFSKTNGGKSVVDGLDTSKFPVEEISWYDAIEYCNKLSVRDGLQPYYGMSNLERERGSIIFAEVSPRCVSPRIVWLSVAN